MKALPEKDPKKSAKQIPLKHRQPLEAIATRLENIATRLEAIAVRLEAIATRRPSLGLSFSDSIVSAEGCC